MVDTLFADTRFMVQGTAALAGACSVCAIRLGSGVFACLAALSFLLIPLRIAQFRQFHRISGPGTARRRSTPDAWARNFGLGALAVAALWGALVLLLALRGDEQLLHFAIIIQCGWLSAASIRNAVSPASVLGQMILTTVPNCVAAGLSQSSVSHLMLPFVAIQFSATWGLARAVRQQSVATLLSEQGLAEANTLLRELSATDGLTGIGNRRAFDAALRAEWGRAARDGTDLALLILDVDRFKAYNDRYGHPAGDDCLREIAALLNRSLRRPPDIAARFGGEEFVALLPGNDLKGAADVAERLRRMVESASLPHACSEFGRVTVSLGVASMAPQPGEPTDTLIALADQALYKAKQAGRNRVECAVPDIDVVISPPVTHASAPAPGQVRPEH